MKKESKIIKDCFRLDIKEYERTSTREDEDTFQSVIITIRDRKNKRIGSIRIYGWLKDKILDKTYFELSN